MIQRIGILLVFALLLSCENTPSEQHTSKKQTPVQIKYAQNFKLSESADGYTLELLDPATKNVDQTIAINPKSNYRILSLTATLNGMLSLLNQQDLLVGVSSYEHIYDPKVKSLIDAGGIGEFGDQSRNSVEKIIASQADIVFYDIVDSKFPNQDKLIQLGISVMPIYDWRENHPLAKAEWIKVVGAITGHYAEADSIFNAVETAYTELKAHASNYTSHPSVLSGHLYQDIWYTPSGDNYLSIMIQDAGGSYRYADTKGNQSLAFSMERIIKENKATDYWINPGDPTKDILLHKSPHYKHLNAFNNDTYCYSSNMAKFWEQSASRPDLMLLDLMHIFHPEDTTITEFNYYENVH